MTNRYIKNRKNELDVIINRNDWKARLDSLSVYLPNRYHELSKEDQAQTDVIINRKASHPETYEISIEWSTLDVQDIRPDLSFQDAVKVLDAVKREHDASVGVNWDVLQAQIDFMYPKNMR